MSAIYYEMCCNYSSMFKVQERRVINNSHQNAFPVSEINKLVKHSPNKVASRFRDNWKTIVKETH